MPNPINLEKLIPGWEKHKPKSRYLVGVLPGEGIGPEVIETSLQVLDEAARRFNLDFVIKTGGKIGLSAYQESGQVLTPEIIELAEAIFAEGGAVLCGPAGGRFVYELRSRFDLFCKISPVQPLRVLQDAGILRPETRHGVDFLLVRENAGGEYFGRWEEKRTGNDWLASHTFEYGKDEVERIIRVAAGLAAQRRNGLTLVVKTEGFPSISRLWMDIAESQAKKAGLKLQVLQADHAAFQLIQTGQEFDVVVSSNLIGDVLADGCGLLLGARGMCHSGNFGKNGAAVYQTGHGSAKDLARRNKANPLGQILSLTMMLEVSFGLSELASFIVASIEKALAEGWRTADIVGKKSTVVGTRELGHKICRAMESVEL